MSSAMKRFLRITAESVFRGIIIAVVVLLIKRIGWL